MGGHQWGDVDIDNILKLIEQASREGGLTAEDIRSRRHTADHMNGWPRPDQIPRIKDLGMILGGTNLYIHQDSPRWLRDYGEKALDRVLPRKGLADAGVMSGIEIDKPIELTDATAFTTLSWSINRKGQDGKVYAPHQRIGREVALKTATLWGAYYLLKENVLGSLEPGKFADFLVLGSRLSHDSRGRDRKHSHCDDHGGRQSGASGSLLGPRIGDAAHGGSSGTGRPGRSLLSTVRGTVGFRRVA